MKLRDYNNLKEDISNKLQETNLQLIYWTNTPYILH